MSSFTRQLTLRLSLLVAATSLSVLLGAGWLLQRQSLRNIELLHLGEIHELAEILGEGPGARLGEVRKQLGQDADSDAWLYYTEILDTQGQLLFRSSNLGLQALAEAAPRSGVYTLPSLGDLYVTRQMVDGLEYVVASSLAPLDSVMSTYRALATVLFLLVSVAGVFISLAFTRVMLQPLRHIRETAQRINAERLDERIPEPVGRDELSSLVRLLNRMFERLQVSFEQNRRFAADASHELKTPLSIIRLHTEKLLAESCPTDRKRELLEDILEESSRLNRLIESLLFLARSESGALRLRRELCELRSLWEDLEADARVLAEDAGVSLSLDPLPDSAQLACDPVLLHQAAINLVSNALRHGRGEGPLELFSRIEGGQWIFRVRDSGPGVPEASLERIFERFERLGDSGNIRSRTGHGLGLAISQAIVRLHAGSLCIRNRKDRSGLEAEIRLPLSSGAEVV